MLDPAEFRELWEQGDDESGSPQSGPFGLDQPTLVNNDELPPQQWQVFDIVALAAARTPPATSVCRADSRPDFWLIALDGTAGTGVRVYQGATAGGAVPLRFGPKGRAIIPARSMDYALTIEQSGATASNVTVVAVRGFPPAMLVRE